MEITKVKKIKKSFKLLLITSFLSVIFLCLQCVTEKPAAQSTTRTSPPILEKKGEQGPSLRIESINEGRAEIVTDFPATLKNIAVERNNDTFSPNLFADVIYPTSFNKDLGFYLPNWIVTLQTTLSKVYTQKRIPLRNRGIWGSLDWHEHNNEGSDWNFFIDPEKGRAYPNNYNTRKSVNMNTFSSALPIERRIQSGNVDLNNWDSKSEVDLAKMGRELARSTEFGDYFVPGKQRLGLVNMDWENNYENGVNPRKSLRFIKSVCDNLQGIFQAMYVHPINAEVGNLTKNGYQMKTEGLIQRTLIQFIPVFKT